MAFIEWTDDFNLDIEPVDSQHRRLVELVNKFDAAMQSGKGSRIMNEVLNELIAYTQEHFAFEEKLMADADYSKLKLHKSQHRQLLQKAERFQFDFSQGGRRITGKVREFLSYWLMNHILQDDMDFAREVKAGVDV